MRIFIIILCVFLCFSADAQKRKKKIKKGDYTSIVLLSQLGRSLYSYEVAATSSNKTEGRYDWRFILAEDNLRGKIKEDIAADLTTFLFSFKPEINRYNGEIVRGREGLDNTEVLSLVYKLFMQNIRRFGSDLDFIRLDGKYHYVLYFPSRNNQLVKS